MKRSSLDAVCALAVVAVAGALRFWALTDLGLTHFDEGAYASTGRWIATGGLEGWAFQAGQSPGLFPVLLGAAFLIFGVHDYVAIGVSAAAGALTAGLLYWIGRRWFGRAEGAAAALFLATCEYHLIYSRLALTDALFALFFWAAAAAFLRGLESRSGPWFGTAGALTALAWNTKYHGFLPLAIAAAWALVCWIASGRPRWTGKKGRSWPAGFAIAGSIAGLGILPWIAAVGFTLGWGGVVRGFWDHSAGQGTLIVTRPAVLGFFLTSWISLPLLVLGGAGPFLTAVGKRGAGLYFAFVSIAVLGGAMFYLSFPRLLLPAVVGLCLSAGVGAVGLGRALPESRRRVVLPLLVGVIGLLNLSDSLPVLNLKTDCYRRAAEFLEGSGRLALTQMSKNFYFYGERPFVELRFQTAERLEELDRRSEETLVAIDPIVGKLPAVQAWIDRRRDRLTPIRRFRIETYEPVLYQGFDPLAAVSQVPAKADFGQIEVFLLSAR